MSFSFPTPNPSTKRHPLEKPVELMQALIDVSCIPGDTMVDPFSGTANSLVAAKLNNVHFWGSEIDPDYFVEGQLTLQALEKL